MELEVSRLPIRGLNSSALFTELSSGTVVEREALHSSKNTVEARQSAEREFPIKENEELTVLLLRGASAPQSRTGHTTLGM
jgi:hypothetical protein